MTDILVIKTLSGQNQMLQRLRLKGPATKLESIVDSIMEQVDPRSDQRMVC